MKTIANYPAYKVVDLEQEVIEVNREFAKSFDFAIPYTSRRHGTLYKSYHLGSVGAYSAEYGEDEETAIEQAKAEGQRLFWINACAVSLSNMEREQEIKFLLTEGQLIKFDNTLLKVVKNRFGDYNVAIVE